MDFSDKLNFLFELTHAEGKELAGAMNVTPPQISKMRRGVRGIPKNREASQVIASFFAKRCGSDYHKDMLSQKLRIAQIRSINSEITLSDIILDWLSDEKSPDDYAARKADDFLHQFGLLYDGTRRVSDEKANILGTGTSSYYAYYGAEGKRLAAQTFLDYILQCKNPYTINILSDEPMSWITGDRGYSKQIYNKMVMLTEQGCIFRRIAGNISDMDEAFESLNRWFPLYMTGKATSYYYKRMRDNLNRITLFVVNDVAVMYSFSVGNIQKRDAVTFFTTDKRTVNAMAEEFESYFDFCEPIMKVYAAEESFEKLNACMVKYEGYEANSFHLNETLSFITLPWNIAMTINAGGREEEKNAFLNCFAQRHKKFKANLEKYSFYDIIRLARPIDAVNGNVQIPAASVLNQGSQCYTPEGYIMHLREIVFLLEHMKNYHVILREEDSISAVIYVKEGNCAILARNTSPFSIFEVTERYLVDAFVEYLRRLVPPEEELLENKKATSKKLRAHIEEVERLLNENKGK